jgi:hypothetical protein
MKTVKVYFFKPSRKWYCAEEMCIFEQMTLKESIKHQLKIDEHSRFEGMLGVVVDHSPPIMFSVDKLKENNDYLEDWMY